MQVIIKRHKKGESESKFETYQYNGERHISVLSLIDKINDSNSLAENFSPIKYDCSCEQGLCGACAMIVNDTITLGCKAFLDELVDKNDRIQIEPLTKFDVVEDLIVDRSILYKTVSEMKLWIEEDATHNLKLVKKQYAAAQCLFCGCCLEACPNYTKGDSFAGAIGAMEMVNNFGKIMHSKHKKEVKKEYNLHFYKDCSKVGACEKVCPAGIPTLSLISEANRESVWEVWKLKGEKK